MVTKKDRRKSGYSTPKATIPKKDLIRFDLFINPEYDDWQNYRDSFRDWHSDFKKIKNVNSSVKFFNEKMYDNRIKMNLKQERLRKRRKAKKYKKNQ